MNEIDTNPTQPTEETLLKIEELEQFLLDNSKGHKAEPLTRKSQPSLINRDPKLITITFDNVTQEVEYDVC